MFTQRGKTMSDTNRSATLQVLLICLYLLAFVGIGASAR